jgi:hypothetical protein
MIGPLCAATIAAQTALFAAQGKEATQLMQVKAQARALCQF